MRVEFRKSALKDLSKLDKTMQQRILNALESFAQHPIEADIKKLKGYEDVFRLRVGDYRAVMEIVWQGDVAYVIRIRHRRDVYQ
ncbi:type II toxin-antitoxin system RelE/ParE family toxin [Ammoniphilus sp. 3BR4]|uniref:type II toxin-antitoxin system RelE family toxin n=1 Tax=Ammoniphilus sp. 3BR4 TaxID=3158265 RepID=UPI0034670C72